MPQFTVSESTEQYIISSKNDTPYEDLTVEKRKNDKRSLKDMINFKKVLSLGTLENSKNFLAHLQETLEEREYLKMKIKSFFPVKLRMKYLDNQFSILENYFTHDLDEAKLLFPEITNIKRSKKSEFLEENKKYEQTFILVNMIKNYKQKCEELQEIKNNLEESTIKECNEKIEHYKNERLKEFHKTDLYLEMIANEKMIEGKYENICNLFKSEQEKNKLLLEEKRTLEKKLSEFNKKDSELNMKSIEMNKNEREVREENKKLKKQVEKYKMMILDTM